MPRINVEQQKKSRPVEWFMLIEEVDSFNTETGLRLGNVWGLIHREEYEAARDYFEGVRSRYQEWTTLKR